MGKRKPGFKYSHEWKKFYSTNFNPDLLQNHFEKYPNGDEEIKKILKARGVISFPHTYLEITADILARIVTSLRALKIKDVVALGVLHPFAKGLIQDSEALKDEIQSAGGKPLDGRAVHLFEGLMGAFTDTDNTPFGNSPLEAPEIYCRVIRDKGEMVKDEFSMDNFLRALFQYAMTHFGDFYVCPLYISYTKNYSNNSFDIAQAIGKKLRDSMDEKIALVCTGDLAHYGGPHPLVKNPRAKIEKSIELCSNGEYDKYFKLSQDIDNDQKHVLPVVREYFGRKFDYKILDYKTAEYKSQDKQPYDVASVLYGMW